MRPAALTIIIIAATAMTMAACTSTQTGQALPSASQTAMSSSGESPGSNGLAGLNACTLLTDAEAQQVVSGAEGHRDLGEQGGSGTSACSWNKSATNDTPSHAIGVTVRPAQGLKDIVVGPSAQLLNLTTSQGRQAAIVKNIRGRGTCMVSVAVGSGRVDLFDAVVGVGASTDSACSVVGKVSDYVEPRLPKS
ncbi:DUF3558 family protein [Amycolatopsis cynarae]|uniref:DUF3558 family protein n=1 Tax=Amycolatopsis cynarae TaxID=2995223 RepID=A0ABY7AYD9_9PSEU|nr:DUF3558 family protein [Amycolatopsis sp. HUAS 11-8]WAL65021.1 DUF3558 family protein [Amycolatopsis sp. HUAS 11-8]